MHSCETKRNSYLENKVNGKVEFIKQQIGIQLVKKVRERENANEKGDEKVKE